MSYRQKKALDRIRRIRKVINIRRNNVPNDKKQSIEVTPRWTKQEPKLHTYKKESDDA